MGREFLGELQRTKRVTASQFESGPQSPPRRGSMDHIHRWRLDAPTGGVVKGTCDCGGKRSFPSELEPGRALRVASERARLVRYPKRYAP